MSTEKRKPEETVCPILTAAEIARGFILNADEPGDEAKTMCLGKDCHMFNVNDRKCGLRHR